MPMIFTDKGPLVLVDKKWVTLSYTLIIAGLEYKVAAQSRNGNLILERAEDEDDSPTLDMSMPTVAAPPALAQSVPQAASPQFMNDAIPAQEISWPDLRAKVQQYMYQKSDGVLTTGKERMVLAENLAKAVGCTQQCAWAWAKPFAARPREKNIQALAAFLSK